MIALLALRLPRRWHAGSFHAHEHAHGTVLHRHLHPHAEGHAAAAHAHGHAVRSPLQAYGIGIVHGAAGSAAVTLLLLATAGGRWEAVAMLLVFALGTVASMALLSAGVGYALGREPVRRRFGRLAPGLDLLAPAFGVWYGLEALV